MTDQHTRRLLELKDAPEHLPWPCTEKSLRNSRARRIFPRLFVSIGNRVYVDLDEADRMVERARNEADSIAKAMEEV